MVFIIALMMSFGRLLWGGDVTVGECARDDSVCRQDGEYFADSEQKMSGRGNQTAPPILDPNPIQLCSELTNAADTVHSAPN